MGRSALFLAVIATILVVAVQACTPAQASPPIGEAVAIGETAPALSGPVGSIGQLSVECGGAVIDGGWLLTDGGLVADAAVTVDGGRLDGGYPVTRIGGSESCVAQNLENHTTVRVYFGGSDVQPDDGKPICKTNCERSEWAPEVRCGALYCTGSEAVGATYDGGPGIRVLVGRP